jgi:hypothetical protein
MGETRVDLLHLLEDLRDAYSGALEETILTEIVANSLDSGASRIFITADPTQATLTVVDDGSGMQRRDLARYHDVAASTKTRGQGIGFAGVGIKLGLLVCEEVVTETRRGKTHVATTWHLASRHRAPWKWTPPPALVAERGTAVRMKLRNALSPLLDHGFIEGTLRRQFQPLLDPTFDDLLAPHYPKGVHVFVNGRPVERERWAGATVAPLEVRLLRKRKPSALGYLVREDHPLPEDRRGLAISTFGKVIRRGWDWLGITPALPDRIGGLIEAPGLAASLTLNKGDFIRVGARGAAYLAYRKALQEAVSRQLAAWGDSREGAEEARPRMLRPLERDLERVLEDLSEDYPLLASLVEHRAGGQKRLPIGGRDIGAEGTEVPAIVAVPPPCDAEGAPSATGETAPPLPAPAEKEDVGPDASQEQQPTSADTLLPGSGGSRKPARYGLGIQFEDRPEDPELGRLIESTVWINQAHPAYRRAVASRSIGYHLSLAVALALAPLAVEPSKEHAFVTAFLSRWGEALIKPKRHGQRRRSV